MAPKKQLLLVGVIIAFIAWLARKSPSKPVVVHAPRCLLPLKQACPEADRLEDLDSAGYSIIRGFLSGNELKVSNVVRCQSAPQKNGLWPLDDS